MAGCLADHTLLDFVAGGLSPEQARAVLAHADVCPKCRSLLAEVARPPSGLSQTPLPEASPPPLPEAWPPPRQIEEYRLLRPLGQGAMGQVYLAHDTRLDRPVAIKFIAALRPNQAARERFFVEARAIARLAHPNVVGVYRAGEVQEHPYLVSEYVRGESLDRLALPLPQERVLSIGLGLARGLAEAHRCGVLHRDIKPANAILAKDGVVKLCDFGLAKLVDPARRLTHSPRGSAPDAHTAAPGSTPADAQPLNLTPPGAFLGTPMYLAPEIWDGGAATTRSDIYALGALLYELLSGRPPHQAASLRDLRRRVLEVPPTPLTEGASGIDAGLADVVERCLRRDPAGRYPTGEALYQALSRCKAGPGRRSWSLRRPRRALVIAGLTLTGALATGWALRRAAGGMATIQGGTFVMGSAPAEMESAYLWCRKEADALDCPREIYEREQPQRQVRVSSFRLDKTEVTTEEFAAWLNQQPSVELRSNRWVYDRQVLLVDLYPLYKPSYGLVYQAGAYRVPQEFRRKPVTQVSWHGALRYCLAHNKRLPTEAEWEFAARGAQANRFPWGHEEPACDRAVIARKPGQLCAHLGVGLADVATTKHDRTPEGIYDLGGNVAEWVMDPFEGKYPPCGPGCSDPRPTVVARGRPVERVFRGGAWNLMPVAARSAGRSRWREDEGITNVGFRCAASVSR